MSEPIRKTNTAAGPQALARSYDDDSCALHTVAAQPNPRYVRAGVQVFKRTVTGNDFVLPSDGAFIPAAADLFGGAAPYGEALFHVELPAGGSCDVQVWRRTEVEPTVDGWLLVQDLGAITDRLEYRVPTRFGEVYFYVDNAVAIGDGIGGNPDPAYIRATGV